MQIGAMMMTRGVGGDRAGMAAIAGKIEAEGFDYVALPDHVVIPRDIASRYPYSPTGEWPGAAGGETEDILIAATFLAAVTERIDILTSVLVLPHRPAVPTARMLATIDRLSGGRLRVGCGAGWMAEEFRAIGAPDFARRGKVTDEYIEAFRALWTEEEPEYHGEFVDFAGVVFAPKPAQKPHPPIWIGGESPPAMRRAARLGDAWYPASGNPRFPLHTIQQLAGGVDKVRAACEQAKRDPATLELAYFALRPVTSEARMDEAGVRALLSGEPAELAADLDRLAGLGFGQVTVFLQTADLSESLERIEWFAREVRPLLGG